MARKLDWTRTRAGAGGFDERTGKDWRIGPQAEFLDDAHMDAGLDYLALPDIYWAAKLARAFPHESVGAHERLKAVARGAALRLYEKHGVNMLLSRTLVFYSRASASKPFPSAYFAAYFDFAAMKLALAPEARHDPPPRRNLKSFYAYREFQARCHRCSKPMMEAEGGFRAFADRVLGLAGERLTARGFPGP